MTPFSIEILACPLVQVNERFPLWLRLTGLESTVDEWVASPFPAFQARFHSDSPLPDLSRPIVQADFDHSFGFSFLLDGFDLE
jgi:hypothetical protein